MSGAMWPLKKDLELHIEQQGQEGIEQVMINCVLSACGTKWGRVSEVYKAKCTGSGSGSSWLLNAQVHNLHCNSH